MNPSEFLKNNERKRNIEKIKIAFVKKNFVDFFEKCLDDNITIDQILRISNKIKNHKQILKNHNFTLDDFILKEEKQKNINYFKSFELLNDSVEKIFITQNASKLMKGLISNKYKYLVNDETKEIFHALALKKVDKEELSKKVGSKIKAIKNSEDFNFALKKEFFSDWNLNYYINKTDQNNNLEIIENKNNTLTILTHNFDSMREIGSNMWCVTRDYRYFDHYTKNNNKMVVLNDFNINEDNPLSQVAFIVSAKGLILEAYDKNDNLIDPTVYQNKYQKIKPMSFEEFKKYTENESDFFDMTTLGDGFKNVCILEGYQEEFKEEFPFIPINKDDIPNVIYNEIIRRHQSKYLYLIDDLDREQKESMLNYLLDNDLETQQTFSSTAQLAHKLFEDPELTQYLYDNVEYFLNNNPERHEILDFFESVVGTYLYSYIGNKDEKIINKLEELFYKDQSDNLILIMNARALNNALSEHSLRDFTLPTEEFEKSLNRTIDKFGYDIFPKIRDNYPVLQFLKLEEHPYFLKSFSFKQESNLFYSLFNQMDDYLNNKENKDKSKTIKNYFENLTYFLDREDNDEFINEISSRIMPEDFTLLLESHLNNKLSVNVDKLLFNLKDILNGNIFINEYHFDSKPYYSYLSNIANKTSKKERHDFTKKFISYLPENAKKSLALDIKKSLEFYSKMALDENRKSEIEDIDFLKKHLNKESSNIKLKNN